MNKKLCITPSVEVMNAEAENMICTSVGATGGDAGIDLGSSTDPVPGTADSREFDMWEEW